jgi:hypothetical protein
LYLISDKCVNVAITIATCTNTYRGLAGLAGQQLVERRRPGCTGEAGKEVPLHHTGDPGAWEKALKRFS